MKTITAILLVITPLWVQASGVVQLDRVKVDVFDKASLYRGAKTYVQYCLGCHSLKHMRYSRLAADLEVDDERVKKELMYVGEKIHDSMQIAMPQDAAANWFGIKTPDLSLIARSRGADWLYSYLRGFYLDEARPFGVNNRVFKDVAMPNALWELQGHRKAIFKTENGQEVITRLKIVKRGSMNSKDFDATVTDLVNFLVYVGEPSQLVRLKMGKWVILYLIIFWIVAYRLKKEYWKAVH